MVSRRASVTVVVALSLSLVGCSHKEEAAKGDAGRGDSGSAVAVLDAGAPAAPPGPADNVNEVGRFPDETSMNDIAAKIADPNVAARNAVPGGALVATLRLGTAVTQIAKHETFILCVFPDPKNATHNLMGWVAEQAFIAGPTIPTKASCPTGQTRLMFDEQDFCGTVCKAPGDCKGGLACTGKANLFAGGKTGAEVSTCTIPAPGDAPAAGAGTAKIVPGVQQAPLAGNLCPPMFVLGPDKLCHRDCAAAACPSGSKCARRGRGQALCEAQ